MLGKGKQRIQFFQGALPEEISIVRASLHLSQIIDIYLLGQYPRAVVRVKGAVVIPINTSEFEENAELFHLTR